MPRPDVNSPLTRFERWIDRLLRGLAYVGGGAIALMMLLTVVDVSMRYLFNSPLGSNVDLTQMAMVVAVFSALGYCAWTGGHVVVDIFAEVLPRRLARPLDFVVTMIGALLMLAIAWQSLLASFGYYRSGEVAFSIEIPLYPFFAVAAFGSLVFAVALFVMALRPGADRPSR